MNTRDRSGAFLRRITIFFFVLLQTTYAETSAADIPSVSGEHHSASRYHRLSEQQLGALKDSIKSLVKVIDPHLNIGIEVVSLATGQVWYAMYQNRLFVPASLLKLVTATAALSRLGWQHTFVTGCYTDGKLLKKVRTLQGNLYIKAGGDPTVTASDVEMLVIKLKELGIDTITGNCISDGSIFDDVVRGPGWMWDDPAMFWNSPVHGLIIDHNCVQTSVAGMGVVATPSVFSSTALTTTSSSGAVTLIKDPHSHLFTLLKKFFKKYGITLSGGYKRGITPKEAQALTYHQSPPLKEIVATMLKTSDNLYADSVFKFLSHRPATPGSWQGGKVVVSGILSAIVPDIEGSFYLVDGSGKSRYNLLSPHQIMQLLQWHAQQDTFGQFINLLAIPADEGSLKTRMLEFGAKLRAKTGTMNGISGLAGYMLTADKEPLAFVIIMNNYTKSASLYKGLEDAICQFFMNYSSTVK